MPSSYIEGALRTYLRANTNISALLGDRIYIVEAPQGVVEPYAIIFMVSSNSDSITLCYNDGAEPRFQINIFTKGHDEAYKTLQIGNTIIDAIQNYNGAMDGITVDYIKAHGVQVLQDEDNEDIFQGIVEFSCRYIR